MNVGSLFSGIGGIEIGFEKQGFNTSWFVEYEPYAQAILRKRFPETIIYGDITTINFTTVPRVDILTGGFPCQDISNAGKRAGIEGSRSSLWKHYLRAIREIRPKYALIENVSALSSRGLDVVLSDLAQIGYDAEWYNLSASSVGAHHRRERLFIIAYPNSSRHIHRESEEQSAERRKYAQRELESSCKDVDYSNSSRFKQSKYKQSEESSNKRTSKNNEWNTEFESKGLWSFEPKLGRVANGISNRLERIRCLGNAVVPQVAEVFAKAIKEKERLDSI